MQTLVPSIELRAVSHEGDDFTKQNPSLLCDKTSEISKRGI